MTTITMKYGVRYVNDGTRGFARFESKLDARDFLKTQAGDGLEIVDLIGGGVIE